MDGDPCMRKRRQDAYSTPQTNRYEETKGWHMNIDQSGVCGRDTRMAPGERAQPLKP